MAHRSLIILVTSFLFLPLTAGCTGSNNRGDGEALDATVGDAGETNGGEPEDGGEPGDGTAALEDDGETSTSPTEPDTGGMVSDVVADAQEVPDVVGDGQDGAEICAAQCEGKECGDDGCGGTCGDCALETPICIDGLCVASDGFCPEAHIEVLEGTEVLPQTTLHLDGTQSGGNGVAIVAYQWTVQQPDGSTSVFLPNDTYATPMFVANMAGEYTFELTVWDELGNPSCEPAVAVVMAQPDAGIHIELIWDTPGDLDQTDQGPEAGADMDLHFAHWFAQGVDTDGDGQGDGWFDQPFDCFWFNAHPNWGSFDPALDDDPGLDLDDTDGAGPENLNLQIPETPTSPDYCYKIGVHYWNDPGYGPSTPTVRVYIFGELVYGAEGPPMNAQDLWFVGEICWPDSEVKPATNDDGGPVLHSDYPNPFFNFQ